MWPPPEQFEAKIEERIKASHEQEANYRFGADVRKFYVEKAKLELPEAFLKRWLIYANEGKFTAEQVEKEFPAFIEDFKWQLVRGYIMQKFGLKVSREALRYPVRISRPQQRALLPTSMPCTVWPAFRRISSRAPQRTSSRTRTSTVVWKSSAKTMPPSPRSARK